MNQHQPTRGQKAALTRRTCKVCRTVLASAKERYGGFCWPCAIDTGERRKGWSLAESTMWIRHMLRIRRGQGYIKQIDIPDCYHDTSIQYAGESRARIYAMPSTADVGDAGRTYTGTWICPSCSIDNFPALPSCLNCGCPCGDDAPDIRLTAQAFQGGQTPIIDAITTIWHCIGAMSTLSLLDHRYRSIHLNHVLHGSASLCYVRLSPWLAACLADELATIGIHQSPRDWADRTLGSMMLYTAVQGVSPATVSFIGSAFPGVKSIGWTFC